MTKLKGNDTSTLMRVLSPAQQRRQGKQGVPSKAIKV
jgi:hypothetical protein